MKGIRAGTLSFRSCCRCCPTTAPRIGDLEIRSFHFDLKFAQFDLSLHLYEEAGGYLGRFEYCTDLFHAETVERLSSNFEQLLHAIVRNPQQRISKLPILAAAERNQILNEWNDTDAGLSRRRAAPRVVRGAGGAHARAHCARCPARRSLPMASSTARANRLAQVLRSRGVGRGQRVGLCVERGADMLAAVLGILKAGAAYVPLDPSFPEERLRFMAEDAQLAAARVHDRPGGLLRSAPRASTAARCRCRDHRVRARIAACRSMRDAAQPEDPAYVIYTSGSTGKPKGVVVPHRAVVNFLTSMAREPGLTADDVLVAVTTLSFDIAVLELQLPLTLGATVVMASRDEAIDGRALSAAA